MNINHIFVIFASFFAIILCNNMDPIMRAGVADESSPMISAVLLECSKSKHQEEEPSVPEDKCGHKAVKKEPCEAQLMVNIRVNPSFHVEKTEKFLVLDEVYDPRRRIKSKLLSPYLIEITRGEPIMMYPLQFSKVR